MNKKKNIIYYSFIIAILNIFDGYATNYGLQNNYIGESNPIMDYLWKVSPMLFLTLKILLSISVIIISILIYKYSRAAFQRFFSYTLLCISILYSIVFFLHIFWMITV